MLLPVVVRVSEGGAGAGVQVKLGSALTWKTRGNGYGAGFQWGPWFAPARPAGYHQWAIVAARNADARPRRRTMSQAETKCPKCGATFPLGHQMCVHCGTRLPGSQPGTGPGQGGAKDAQWYFRPGQVVASRYTGINLSLIQI